MSLMNPDDPELKRARLQVDEEIRRMRSEGVDYVSKVSRSLELPQLPELDDFHDIEAWEDAEITSLQALRAKGLTHWNILNRIMSSSEGS